MPIGSGLSGLRMEGLAWAFWCFAVLVAGFHIVLLFVWITLGGSLSHPVWVGVLWALGVDRNLDLTSYSAMQALSLLALPAIVRLSLPEYRAAGPASGLLTVAALSLPLVLALSYRFPALVAAVGFAWAVRRAGAGAHPRIAWVFLSVALLLSFAPVDISLRVRPLGPRLAPTLDGLLTGTASRLDASGEVVIVGSCGAIYKAPSWVWVW